MPKFRKKPVEIEAVRWTGDNISDVNYLAASHFVVLDEEDRKYCDDPEATAQVFDVLHSTWVLVYTGDWIIRGVQGEHYPCRPDVFEATYEPIEQRPRMPVAERGCDTCSVEPGEQHGVGCLAVLDTSTFNSA